MFINGRNARGPKFKRNDITVTLNNAGWVAGTNYHDGRRHHDIDAGRSYVASIDVNTMKIVGNVPVMINQITEGVSIVNAGPLLTHTGTTQITACAVVANTSYRTDTGTGVFFPKRMLFYCVPLRI